jgi:Flp pilus assembly protein TadD
MGEVHLAEGQPVEALRLLDRAHRAVLLLGWSENEWLARVLLQRGRALDRLGRRPEAMDSYRQVSEVDNAPKMTKREAEACLRAPCH